MDRGMIRSTKKFFSTICRCMKRVDMTRGKILNIRVSTGHCPWKGVASYLNVVVFGEKNENAAWYYPHPSPLARKIKDRAAFWHGVQIQEDERAEVRDEPRASAHGA
jgi:uncharacterized protein (DUF427 family)